MDSLLAVLGWAWRNIVPVLGILGFALGLWNLKLARARERRERDRDERERRGEGRERIKEREAVEAELSKARLDLVALDNAWANVETAYQSGRHEIHREEKKATSDARMRGTTDEERLKRDVGHAFAVYQAKMEALDAKRVRELEKYELERKDLLDKIGKLDGKLALIRSG